MSLITLNLNVDLLDIRASLSGESDVYIIQQAVQELKQDGVEPEALTDDDIEELLYDLFDDVIFFDICSFTIDPAFYNIIRTKLANKQ